MKFQITVRQTFELVVKDAAHLHLVLGRRLMPGMEVIDWKRIYGRKKRKHRRKDFLRNQ